MILAMLRIPFLGFSEPISSITHLLLALLFLIGGGFLIYRGRGNGARVISLSIYTFCLVFLFSMSGVYHLLTKGTDANYVLQILDHAGIYLMIAGSFTPYHIILLRGTARWVPLIIIWLMAIVGLTLTSVFFDQMPESLLLSFFIAMGWMSIFTLYKIKQVDATAAFLIFLGGVLYTLGAIFDFTRWPVLIPRVWEAHEIFHLFVGAAAMVHWWAVYRTANKPISSKLMVVVTEFPEKIKARLTSEQVRFMGQNIEEVQKQVLQWVEQAFHPKHKPKHIRFRYIKEDLIIFEQSQQMEMKK